jgi:translation initiation factor IF-2
MEYCGGMRMSSKVRVYELAKELNTESKRVIEILVTLGYQAKNHMSVVEEEHALKIKSMLAPGSKDNTVSAEAKKPKPKSKVTESVHSAGNAVASERAGQDVSKGQSDYRHEAKGSDYRRDGYGANHEAKRSSYIRPEKQIDRPIKSDKPLFPIKHPHPPKVDASKPVDKAAEVAISAKAINIADVDEGIVKVDSVVEPAMEQEKANIIPEQTLDVKEIITNNSSSVVPDQTTDEVKTNIEAAEKIDSGDVKPEDNSVVESTPAETAPKVVTEKPRPVPAPRPYVQDRPKPGKLRAYPGGPLLNQPPGAVTRPPERRDDRPPQPGARPMTTQNRAGAPGVAQNRPGQPLPKLNIPKPDVPEKKEVSRTKKGDASKLKKSKEIGKKTFEDRKGKLSFEENFDLLAKKTPSRARKIKKPDGSNVIENAELIVGEKKTVILNGPVLVKDLAAMLGESASDVVKKLILLGEMAAINQTISEEMAGIVVEDYGYEVRFGVEAEPEEEIEISPDFDYAEDDEADLVARPPVVVVMGHVDHGKTSLLDAIRETNVISSEAGGITQHIGAYQVKVKNRKITFLDTPGHEAFTAMRARGAKVTDIAVLVVAADDGVMPQTIEAIDHAKAANIAIMVAVNKMDKPGANPDRVMQQLADHNLLAESWGGQTITVPVSAKQRDGIDDLLDMVLLVADVLEVKANPKRKAMGTVIESKLDKAKGPVATVLVQNGTLKVGDPVVFGMVSGKVRAMNNDKGDRVKEARPSTPVEVIGLDDVPQAGDVMYVCETEKIAKDLAESRRTAFKSTTEGKSTPRVTLDDLFKQIQEGVIKDLNVIIKADVQGSAEAIKQSLEGIESSEVRVRVIHQGVGAITETDVMLASASNAIIIGFNVQPDSNARKLSETEEIDVRSYRVIYEAIADIKSAMEGLLEPEYKEVFLGKAEVRDVIRVPKIGNIAGSYVLEGKLTRGCKARLIRDGVVILDGDIGSLRRFKDDVKEVATNYECGIVIENFNDYKEGDIIDAYMMEQIKKSL